MYDHEIRRANVVRYVTPLREGGSLPAIIEADDGFLYVMKFRGAGQGVKALVAEIIGGELARVLGLKVPELVFLDLDESFSKTEPDEEIQDLLKFSIGLNVGLHFLSGSITFDPIVNSLDPVEASLIVLLDAIITNIDRTPKNANLLHWNKEVWLIDHGASLYFHHSWENRESAMSKTFPMIKDHILIRKSTRLAEAAELIKNKVNTETLINILDQIPGEFLSEGFADSSEEEVRKEYSKFIMTKIDNIDLLIKEAEDGR